jgi:hypothetical protein
MSTVYLFLMPFFILVIIRSSALSYQKRPCLCQEPARCRDIMNRWAALGDGRCAACRCAACRCAACRCAACLPVTALPATALPAAALPATALELQNDEARGTGCNYDGALVWSSTTAPYAPHDRRRGANALRARAPRPSTRRKRLAHARPHDRRRGTNAIRTRAPMTVVAAQPNAIRTRAPRSSSSAATAT